MSTAMLTATCTFMAMLAADMIIAMIITITTTAHRKRPSA